MDDPAAVVAALRASNIHIDLFTFMQKLPATSPRYAYAMEWDNVAALPVSTFDHWWTKQINDKTRNVVRLAEKKGIAVREVPFDDQLVRGMSAVYNESPVRQGKTFPHYGKDLDTVRTGKRHVPRSQHLHRRRCSRTRSSASPSSCATAGARPASCRSFRWCSIATRRRPTH